MTKFSKSEAIKYGWNTTKANFKFLIKVFLVVGVIYIINSIISEQIKDINFIINFLIGIIFLAIQTIINMGLLKIALKYTYNQKPIFSELYSQYPLFLKYFFGTILTGIIVILGLMLLIIPGIILAIKLKFVGFLIVDKSLGPIDAIKGSWRITKGVTWNLFLFTVLTALINLAGALALLIGLLWTIPTTTIATAYVYRKLSQS